MKNLLAQMIGRLEGAPLGTKATLGAVLLALIGVVAAAIGVSNRPHYELLRSGLSAEEFARVGEALAGANVAWRGSQPPGPFVVWVDGADRARAFDAVMLTGALKDVEGGILGGGGSNMGSVFMYSKEREQLTRKKEWQDMEAMLEFQDFIQEARVRTSAVEEGPFGRRGELTASVTLVTRGGASLTRAQSRTVAELVRLGLGIAPSNLVVADQNGRALYEGPAGEDGTQQLEEWSDRADREDERLATEANQVLEQILGPGLARVTVRSDWDFDQSVTLADTADPKAKTTLSEQRTTTETPVYGNAGSGGAVGSAANLVDSANFGIENQAVADLTRASGTTIVEPGTAKTSEESKSYVPSRVLSETVRRAPLRRRMSVSLWIDESLGSQREALADAVKATVGFDAARNDLFQSVEVPFARPEEGAEEALEAPEESAPPMWLEILLDRGIELIAGLVFAVILFSTLRKSKQPLELSPQEPGGSVELAPGEAEPEPDPELIALEKVRSLLANEPEKVGDMLTAWARGEEA